MRSTSRSKTLSDADRAAINSASSLIGNRSITSFDEALSTLITRCVRKGLADVTVTYYKNELRVFRYYLSDCNPKALDDISAISTLDIPKFRNYMRDVRGAKVGNINTKVKALKTFFNTNDMREIANECSPISDKTHFIIAFTTEQVRKLLNTCDLTSFYGVRDYTMMLVFADAGIRVKELINLEVSDFHPMKGAIHIRHSKNGFERYAPVSAEVVAMVKALISVNHSKTAHDRIFQSIYGEPLARRSINNRIAIAGDRANIREEVRCSPHTFRHYFAKTTIENGANVFQLQKMLGHSSLEMVKEYVNLFDREVFEAHKKYSPKNNLIR